MCVCVCVQGDGEADSPFRWREAELVGQQLGSFPQQPPLSRGIIVISQVFAKRARRRFSSGSDDRSDRTWHGAKKQHVGARSKVKTLDPLSLERKKERETKIKHEQFSNLQERGKNARRGEWRDGDVKPVVEGRVSPWRRRFAQCRFSLIRVLCLVEGLQRLHRERAQRRRDLFLFRATQRSHERAPGTKKQRKRTFFRWKRERRTRRTRRRRRRRGTGLGEENRGASTQGRMAGNKLGRGKSQSRVERNCGLRSSLAVSSPIWTIKRLLRSHGPD